MALCATLLAGLAGAAAASPRSHGGIQLAQSERYRPSNPSYEPRSYRRRIWRRGGGGGDRYGSPPPGSLNYGRGNDGFLPMGQVVPNVRRAVGGQVLRGGLRGAQYWFRVLTRDGRVVDVYADARTGRILSVRGAR